MFDERLHLVHGHLGSVGVRARVRVRVGVRVGVRVRVRVRGSISCIETASE